MNVADDGKVEIHDRDITQRVKNLKKWKVTEETKKDIITFLQQAAIGKVNRGKKLCEARRAKYLDVLKIPLEFFGKDAEKLASEDIEIFEKALSLGKIKSRLKKKPYSNASQVDIKRGLKVFLKWKLGEARALELAGWLDTRGVIKTPEFLSEREIEKLYKECKTKEQRFLIAVLFDSGARATEFHNIRYEDVEMPESGSNYVKLTLKQEYSKTKGRTISLFWRKSLEAVRDYLDARIEEGIRAKDPVFTTDYDTARRFLYDIGKRVLGKSLHYHLFRHSSATYYADKMNRQQLCIRYGWGFSSRMPDIYIARKGVDERELETRFTGGEVSKLRDELEKERQQSKIEINALLEKNKESHEKIERVKNEFSELKEFLMAKLPDFFIDGPVSPDPFEFKGVKVVKGFVREKD